MWLDLVRGSLVNDELEHGKAGECWRIMRPKMRRLISGDINSAELLNQGLKDVWESSNVVAKSPQALRSIGGNSWRVLVWATLSILSTTGNELPVFGKMSERVLPDWIRERVRVTLPFNSEIYQDPPKNFIMLELGTEYSGGGVASPEELRRVLERNPEMVTGISILWCKTQFSDSIKEYMLWSQIGQVTQRDGHPPVKHCFVTVPSASRAERMTETGMPSKRVQSFDGGAFWGVGEIPGTPMKGVFDIIPDWRDRITELHSIREESLLCKRLGLLD